MIYSRFEEFSNAQAITGDAAATNDYDQLNAGGAIGTEMYAVFIVEEDFDNLTTLTINLVTDTALPIDGSSVVLASKTVALADLTAGTQAFVVRVPREQQRYVSAYYDVTGTNPTAGKITAFLTNNIQQHTIVE